MSYIYPFKPAPLPDDVGDLLDMLSFNVNNGMELVALWSGTDSENPFAYYINEDNELILEVD